MMERAEIVAPSPDISDAQDLLDAMMPLGLGASNGMGLAPVSVADIAAWSDRTGADLTTWEFRMWREMSLAFCQGHGADEPPYMPTQTKMAIATASMLAEEST